MATKSKRKGQGPSVSSETLAAQTEAFLKDGGTIEYVKSGVSGQQNLPGRKHITLDSKAKG